MHSLSALLILAAYMQTSSAVKYHATTFKKGGVGAPNFVDTVWPGPNSGLAHVKGLDALRLEKHEKTDKKDRKIPGSGMASVKELKACDYACTGCKTRYADPNEQTPNGVVITEAYYCASCKYEGAKKGKAAFTIPTKVYDNGTFKVITPRPKVAATYNNVFMPTLNTIGASSCWYPHMEPNYQASGDLSITVEFPATLPDAANGMKIYFNVGEFYEPSFLGRDKYSSKRSSFDRKNKMKATGEQIGDVANSATQAVGGLFHSVSARVRPANTNAQDLFRNDESESSRGEKEKKEKGSLSRSNSEGSLKKSQ